MAEVIIFVPCFDRSAPRHIVNFGALAVASSVHDRGIDIKYVDGSSGNLRDVCQNLVPELADCVYFGVSAFTAQVCEALTVCEFVRSVRPDLPIVWGGIHASLLPEETARDPLVDYVCIGEGDYAAVELYEQLSSSQPDVSKVHNLVYEEDGEIVRTDIAPFFDMTGYERWSWELLDLERYVVHNEYDGGGVPSMGIPVGRSCPHRCAFCVNVALKDYGYTTYRRRNPEQVEGELVYLKERLGVGFVFLRDEVSFIDIDFNREIGEVFHRHGVKWGANIRANYFTPRRVTKDYCKEMRELGMLNACVGIESGNPRVLKEVVHKDITLEQIFHAVECLEGGNIRPFFSYIIGFPTETQREAQDTVDLAFKLKKMSPRSVNSGFSLLRPYPGAPIYDLCVEHGFRSPQGLREWGESHLTRQGGFNIDRMPWLAGRGDLYTFCEYAGASMLDIERTSSILRNGYILTAKIRRRLGFYRFPLELWMFRYVRKAVYLTRKFLAYFRRDVPSQSVSGETPA